MLDPDRFFNCESRDLTCEIVSDRIPLDVMACSPPFQPKTEGLGRTGGPALEPQRCVGGAGLDGMAKPQAILHWLR
jgi:hypothetical protein